MGAIPNRTKHISTDAPRVLIVDGSKATRIVITQALHKNLPNADVISCASGAEALEYLSVEMVDFITTALQLPDMDGLAFAHEVRENQAQAYIPIIVVSGSAQERLSQSGVSHEITDYFDKSLGYQALVQFIHGYVAPPEVTSGTVLYIEDSKVVAISTRRMLEKFGLTVQHVISVEEALHIIQQAQQSGIKPADIILTDVYLKGQLTGKDLLDTVRGDFGYNRGDLPVLVMTADDDTKKQAALLRAGANDLVHKPVEERLLITKLIFQLRVAANRQLLNNR